MDEISKAQNSEKTHKKSFGKPWVKGQSGNPGGRPKKKPITQIFEELFDANADRDDIKEQVRKTLTSKGMAGVLLLREAADRIEGHVKDEVDLNVTGSISLAQVIEERRKKRGSTGKS